MKLTKYQHACFTLEKNDKLLVIDPGSDTHDFVSSANIAGVLITHEHSDHFSHDFLQTIVNDNPDVVLVGPEHTVESFGDNGRVISVETELEISDFTIRIFPGRHDAVHPDFPTVPMLRYLIDEKIYYGGDTVSIPDDIHPLVMAVPVSSNWFRFSDVVDMVRKLQPNYAFPTHDRLLSDVGKKQADFHITNLTRDYNVEYTRLDSTTPLIFDE